MSHAQKNSSSGPYQAIKLNNATSIQDGLKTRSLEEEILVAKSRPAPAVAIALLMITSVISYFAHDSVPMVAWASWSVAMTFLIIFRALLQSKIETDQSIPQRRRMKISLLLTAATGFTHASSFLFFPSFDIIERSVHTIMLLGLANGSISTNSGYRPFVLAYSLPIVTAVMLAWGFSDFGDESNIVIYSVLLLNSVYYVVMYSNCISHYRLFRESYKIREQQAGLNAELADKNVALDSALNQALQARKEADLANKSKTRFLASASHDLRQPTHALSLLAGVLTRQKLDDKSMSIALDIHQASQSLQALMTGLLDISKLDAGLMVPRIESVDLSWVINRVCNEFETLANDKGLKLLFTSKHSSANTRSDPQLTERILRNLVSNAVKYTDKGLVEVGLDKTHGQWKITIKDSGCGIALQEQERIFEEFYQVGNAHRDSAKGLGLGLAIVKRLCDTLRLSLTYSSELGIGTTFSFSMPVINDDIERDDVEAQSNTLEGVHILCVDDEKDIRRAMSLVFELLKCSFDLVDGIEEALEASKLRKPDIILADNRLVGELSGVDVIREIRKVHPSTPALLVTGDTSPERLKVASDANIEMLHKPLTMEKLVQAVEEKLNM